MLHVGRALSRGFAALFLLFVFPAISSAATITLSASMSDCDPHTQVVSSTTVDAELSVSTGVCPFQFGWGGEGEAAANGVFDEEGLQLGVMASLEGRASTFAEAIAYFSDTIIASGGETGSSGYLSFTFTVDGAITCTVGVCFEPEYDDRVFAFLGIRLGPAPDISSGGRMTGTRLTSGTNTVTLEVPIVFGAATEFTIGMRAFADMSGQAVATETADFLNTALLTQVAVLGADRTVLSGGGITSTAGLAYPSASVPEPGTLLLLGTGIVAAVGSRRRRAQRREAGRS